MERNLSRSRCLESYSVVSLVESLRASFNSVQVLLLKLVLELELVFRWSWSWSRSWYQLGTEFVDMLRVQGKSTIRVHLSN